ncbi:hypothetical protein MSAN_01979300 [Mycena sanguinolenta]|uniref:Uncharacterized protein n=1 Tax=Mycena sanguinolenta TaxID=230812 RepID=A0A8H7CQA8_9AGAR|nr:hypothetical protein MSAN_01979300 [Mycena sanguinolenta]
MFSHSYHHHQPTPEGHRPATATQTLHANRTSAPDLVSDHYQRLESLLDSALATLALINVTTPVPIYCSRIRQVVQALDHYTSTQPTTPTPDLATKTDTDPTTAADPPRTAPTPATYAGVVRQSTSPEPTTSDPHIAKHLSRSVSLAPPAGQPPPSPRSDQVVIRFDLKRIQPTVKPDPESLYLALEKALGTGHYLGGVRWTQRGNLVIAPETDTCTAKHILYQHEIIWAALHPLLGLPPEYTPPPFQIDGESRWHFVVIHGVPVQVALAECNLRSVESWIDPLSDFKGTVNAVSILCPTEEVKTRRSVAIRIALSSGADAQRLVAHGACFYGVKCRVSHYTRRRAPVAGPTT